MAYSFSGTGQYLTCATSVTAAPLTLAVRFRPGNVTRSESIVSAWADSFNWFGIFVGGNSGATSAQIAASCFTSGNSASAGSTTNVSTGVWYHACAVFTSSTSRTIYLDGGSSATNATSAAVSIASAPKLGIAHLTSGSVPFTGQIAEYGVWSAALTASEALSLSRGVACNLVRPQSLVSYLPLIRSLLDQRTANAITTTGSPTIYEHPRVYAA